MQSQRTYRSSWILSVLIISLISAGCSMTTTSVPSTVTPATPKVSTPTAEVTKTAAQPTPAAVADKNVLYQDDFTNSASGWPEEKFDNYFVGYHEPEFYHVEISSANYKTTVFEPTKQNFTDTTIEVKAFAVSKKTATTGDFIYGVAFRRSGDNFYAFTISPRTKKWSVLKSSSAALKVLAEGKADGIHDLDAGDILRVDAQGSKFSFYINGQSIGHATDKDYASGEVGFYVQTFDTPNLHVHFDSISIRKPEVSQSQSPSAKILYKDDFTNSASGWAEKKFDNYFIGYHEPEFYHVEITSPNYKTTVFEPTKQNFGDITIEIKAFTNSKKTSATGDFAYGPVFRRSGDNYYAFTISPRTKKWSLLKSSPSALAVLAEGTEAGINDLDVPDTLQVDVQGSKFLLHINDKLVGQVTDKDYANGEVGLFVQTFDATNVHVHFDSLTISDYQAPQVCKVTASLTYIRKGPGTSFASIVAIARGHTVVPLARNTKGDWLQIALENNQGQGWVLNSKSYISCSANIDALPVVNP